MTVLNDQCYCGDTGVEWLPEHLLCPVLYVSTMGFDDSMLKYVTVQYVTLLCSV